MGDPDLSASERGAEPRSQIAGRGLVVFPAPRRARGGSLLVRYAPFLITVILGAVLVSIVAVVR